MDAKIQLWNTAASATTEMMIWHHGHVEVVYVRILSIVTVPAKITGAHRDSAFSGANKIRHTILSYVTRWKQGSELHAIFRECHSAMRATANYMISQYIKAVSPAERLA